MQRVTSIEYIRGLAMLGVIGIHTGAWSLSNPHVNIHLFALFEIVSRFSVPIFFFITAFGIYYPVGRESVHELQVFPGGRIRTVLLPYLLWSLMYMVYYSWRYNDQTIWQSPLLHEILLFGQASYQLYFLVLLLVFLAFTPLLARLALWLCQKPLPRMGCLLLLQILFNVWSSYGPEPSVEGYWLKLLLKYRLNYWPLHYLWIYMLGAVFAFDYSYWMTWLQARHKWVAASFWGSLALMLLAYYGVVLGRGFSLEQAAFTIHQLSPMGIVYTGAAALYFSLLFAGPLSPRVNQTLSLLAQHSFFSFLVHPFIMGWLQDGIVSHRLVMNMPITILFYLLTVSFSLALSVIVKKISSIVPLISIALVGKSPSKTRSS